MTPNPTAREIAATMIRPGEFLRVTVGSEVHGVTVGSDDHDEMGVMISPPASLLGLDHFEQYQWRTQPKGVRSGAGDTDLVVYSLRKWMSLAVKGNPSILVPLYVPEEHVRHCTDLGRELREELVRLIVSEKVRQPYLGYLRQQKERLLGVRGGKHTNRPELIEQYGFDTKYAYHMVRLGYQGSQLLLTGRIPMPVPEPMRTYLLELRRGERSMDWAVEMAEHFEEQIARVPSVLPASPDIDQINRWMVHAHLGTWGPSREIAAAMPPGPDACPDCGGEGVIDGLVTGDRISDEPCHHPCHERKRA